MNMSKDEYDQKVAAINGIAHLDEKDKRKRIRALTRRFNRQGEESVSLPRASKAAGKMPALPSDGTAPKMHRPRGAGTPMVMIFTEEMALTYARELAAFLFEYGGIVEEANDIYLQPKEDLFEAPDELSPVHPTYWTFSVKEAYYDKVQGEDVLAAYRSRWGVSPTHLTYMNLPGLHICLRSEGKDFATLAPKR
jgi:hypothetical protein